MPSDQTTGVKASRPKIMLAGQEDADLKQGLLAMSVEENVEGLARAELRFGNWGPKDDKIGYLYFDGKKLDFGKEIEVRVDDDALFAGRISAIEVDFREGAGSEISVLLEDRLQDLRMTRRTRTFSDQSDADIIRSIASDHGLQASVDISAPAHKVVAQVNQSDLAFIRERARAAGAELWIEGRTLNAKPRSARGGSPVKLKYGAELREFNVLADLAHQRTKVNVSGWDISGKSAIKESADDAALGNELGSDKSGAAVLRNAFGERAEAVAHMVPLTSSEAQAQAESWFRAAARRFLVGRGTAQPNGKLRVGVSIDLDGLGKPFNGKYYLAEVQHRFDGEGGFRSEFTAERPGLGSGQ